MFHNDVDADAELMAEEEPEWQDDGDEEQGIFPEEPDYQYDPAAETRRSRLPAVMGFVFLAFGLAHAAILVLTPASLEGFASSLANLGLTPAHPILAGLVFWVISRQQAPQPLDMTALEDQLRERFDDFITKIPSSDGSGAGIEDVDRILMALQRQDEKVNNLTRATKMYGKPMVEISTQVSDTANHVKDLIGAINELREQVGKISEPLVQGFDQMQSQLGSIAEKQGKTAKASLKEFQQQLAASTEKLMTSVEKSPVTELENTLQSIQRELSGIATGISEIQNRPALSPQGAIAAAPTAATPATTAAAPSAPESQVGAPSATPPGGLAHSIAGAHKGGGKNVLGAIAKLKSMRK